jgi:hypothetical protein
MTRRAHVVSDYYDFEERAIGRRREHVRPSAKAPRATEGSVQAASTSAASISAVKRHSCAERGHAFASLFNRSAVEGASK